MTLSENITFDCILYLLGCLVHNLTWQRISWSSVVGHVFLLGELFGSTSNILYQSVYTIGTVVAVIVNVIGEGESWCTRFKNSLFSQKFFTLCWKRPCLWLVTVRLVFIRTWARMLGALLSSTRILPKYMWPDRFMQLALQTVRWCHDAKTVHGWMKWLACEVNWGYERTVYQAVYY